MGILDNDTITVDAILTKVGRRLLAKGQGLNIRHYALSDDFINYKDWNVSHPSGSANYAEAMTSLPLPEAVTSARIGARFALTTRDRNAIYNPIIKLNQLTEDDNNVMRITNQGKQYAIKIEPTIENAPGGSQFEFTINDISGISVMATGGGGSNNLGAADHVYPQEVGIPHPAVYTGNSITIAAQPTETAFSFLVVISAPSVGASPVDVQVNVDSNIMIEPTDKIT